MFFDSKVFYTKSNNTALKVTCGVLGALSVLIIIAGIFEEGSFSFAGIIVPIILFGYCFRTNATVLATAKCHVNFGDDSMRVVYCLNESNRAMDASVSVPYNCVSDWKYNSLKQCFAINGDGFSTMASSKEGKCIELGPDCCYIFLTEDTPEYNYIKENLLKYVGSPSNEN